MYTYHDGGCYRLYSGLHTLVRSVGGTELLCTAKTRCGSTMQPAAVARVLSLTITEY